MKMTSAGSRGNILVLCNILGSCDYVVVCFFYRNKMANQAQQEKTFQYQGSLPSLPVPSLESSLAKYLDAGATVGFYGAVMSLQHVAMQEG